MGILDNYRRLTQTRLCATRRLVQWPPQIPPIRYKSSRSRWTLHPDSLSRADGICAARGENVWEGECEIDAAREATEARARHAPHCWAFGLRELANLSASRSVGPRNAITYSVKIKP